MQSDLDEPTIPATWTPDSSPGMGYKRDVVIRQISVDSSRHENGLDMHNMRTLSDKDVHGEEMWRMETIPGSTRNSVGVAF